ncbi:MAG TPA: DNA primase [Acidimicrobiales bacterium]|nr:DNA primase [Acidimicrobiales bacterium]
MGIVTDDIARVRQASDIIQIAGEHIALRKVGRRYVGLCPFHAEKSPSFSVNAEEGLYFCFGCGAKGDVITFVREVQHLEFAEAVETLAGRAGIQVRYDDAAVSRERQRHDRLVEAMRAAVDWYHERLLSGPDAAAARAYLRSRGYDGEIVRTYGLGWAPDDWDALCRHLKLPVDVLKDTGLGFLNRRERQQDSFRGRLMFPIFDVRGDPVAFGGRSLPGGPPPKYKNSPETPIYSKRRVLYGLNWAKAGIVKSEEVVVCEGYTDVMGLGAAGIPRAVATCGTALADEHFRTLKNFARRVVLAYDADAAGQAAAARFYEWERLYEVDIAVADLPQGTDPGELARRDPEALKAAISGARPFLAFRLERVLAAADLRNPESRARAAEAALGVIREHPSELVRDQYLMEVADRTRIEPDRLRSIAASPPQQRESASRSRLAGPSSVERRADIGQPAPGSRPELEALRLALHHPDAILGRLSVVLFDDEVALGAYRALAESDNLHDAIAGADPAAATLLQRLAVEDPRTDADDVMARLAEEAGRRALADLEIAARHAEDPMSYAPVTGWLKLTLEGLRDPSTAVEATTTLVRWLVDQFEVEK